MSILSIDVGIRHLSYVVLNHQYNVNTNSIDIFIEKNDSIDFLWNIIDITPDKYQHYCNVPKSHQHKCKNKCKYLHMTYDDELIFYITCEEHREYNCYENEIVIEIHQCNNCKNKAYCFTINTCNESKQIIDTNFYCKKHSKNIIENTYIIQNYNCNYNKYIENVKCNQPAVCIHNNNAYCQRHKTIHNIKNDKNTLNFDRNKLQLEEIYQSMIRKLDNHLIHWKNVKTICIEKQPPKNPRMKSIMSSLQSYFIIRGTVDDTPLKLDINNIHCIDAKNKLNVYEQNNKYPKVIYEKKKTKNAEYEKRKHLSIKYTENILITDNQNEEYQHFINNADKKDDLADCYLQGRFYIENILGKKTINQNNQWNNYCNIELHKIPKRFCFSDKVCSKKKILNLMSLKYILNKYPLSNDNYDKHLFKNQITNSINKYFGNLNFYFEKI